MRRVVPVGLMIVGLMIVGLTQAATAADLRGRVSDANGGLKDAVIYATPLAGLPPGAARQTAIDQINKRYVPFVTVIPVGTTVAFPNKDNIKHHVYSVSPPKRFERPLYTGRRAEPVLFDKPGEVTLGCNIHDWMIAHVLVLETPYAALTDKAGQAVISNLPAGDYEVRVWHPGMKGKNKAAKIPRIVNVGAGSAEVDFTVNLLPKKRWWREKPRDADQSYPDFPAGDH